MKKYIVNGKEIKIKTIDFEGGKSINDYKKQIFTALGKIGITREYIKIDSGGRYHSAYAHVEWSINGKKFSFHCEELKSRASCMGAIAQALQGDVRHITRGIKDFWHVLRQYESLPSPEEVKETRSINNPYLRLSLQEVNKLFFANHPDHIGKENFNQERFDMLKKARDIKKKDVVK